MNFHFWLEDLALEEICHLILLMDYKHRVSSIFRCWIISAEVPIVRNSRCSGKVLLVLFPLSSVVTRLTALHQSYFLQNIHNHNMSLICRSMLLVFD